MCVALVGGDMEAAGHGREANGVRRHMTTVRSERATRGATMDGNNNKKVGSRGGMCERRVWQQGAKANSEVWSRMQNALRDYGATAGAATVRGNE